MLKGQLVFYRFKLNRYFTGKVVFYKFFWLFSAHLLDGVKLNGYFAWTLIDNFEWAAGFTERFGLHYVDFDDPKRLRTPRKSASVFQKIVEQNGFSEAPTLDF